MSIQKNVDMVIQKLLEQKEKEALAISLVNKLSPQTIVSEVVNKNKAK